MSCQFSLYWAVSSVGENTVFHIEAIYPDPVGVHPDPLDHICRSARRAGNRENRNARVDGIRYLQMSMRGRDIDVDYSLTHVSAEKVVVIAHGLFAHKDKARFVALEKELLEDGYSVLRFTFSYINDKTEKKTSIVDSQVRDIRKVIDFLKEKGYARIGIVGESYGGGMSLVSFRKEIVTYVLWAPVTSHMVRKRVYLTIVFGKLFPSHARFPFDSFDSVKNFFRQSFLIESAKVLEAIAVPVLILHGDKDEVVPLRSSRIAAGILPNARLVPVDGAGHIFDETVLPVAFHHTRKWFHSYL